MKNTPTFLVLGMVILVSSLAAVSMAYLSLKNAEDLADQALENLGRSLSGAVEYALPTELSLLPESRELLDRVLADELVAFARVTDGKGLILYHSNPDLEGQIAETGTMDSRDASSRTTLGTGERVFEYRSTLRADPPLRFQVFLRTVKADRIVKRARVLFITVILVVTLLWVFGVVALWSFIRRRRMEVELQEKQHLAYLGQMSAVLAHELRNALGSIKGYAQYLEEKVSDHPPWTLAVETIVRESRRIEHLVSELLLYSKPYDPVYGPVPLGPLLAEVVRNIEQEGYRVSLDMSDEVVLESDEEKLRSVFDNLVRNAGEAMEGKGIIKVSCKRNREGVRVEVLDEGPGLGPEALKMAFMPFFTTKSRGSGLGLAYSKKLVDGLGGRIRLSNRPDRSGALAAVFLPGRRSRG